MSSYLPRFQGHRGRHPFLQPPALLRKFCGATQLAARGGGRRGGHGGNGDNGESLLGGMVPGVSSSYGIVCIYTLYIYLSTYIYVYLYLYNYLYYYLYVYLYISLSIYLSTYLSIYLSFYPSIHLSYLSYPSMYLSN
jgi:hypothetical protein